MQKIHISMVKALGLAAGLAFLGLLLFPPGISAQSTGTVGGTVFDQTGAVVQKASISLVNEKTNDARKISTNDVGYFSFPSVVPGTYTVKVSYTGFKAWEQTGLIVRPGDVRDVAGISLQIGRPEEVITVEAVTPEVAPVTSGERSATLTSQTIQSLALQGRDITELLRVLPGVSAFSGGGVANFSNTLGYDPNVVSVNSSAVGNGFTANGAVFRGGTDLVSDGAHVIDTGCNCSATQTVNADMVSEVKVQTSNFGADSAKGPVVVNAVGKSGGQDYHGQLYLYARDGTFNTLPWEVAAAKIKPSADRYLYPGGNFGGPVPGTNKKLLFWGGYEYYRQNLNQDNGSYALAAAVPTASMRAGNFDPAAEDNAYFCSNYGGAWAACASPNGSNMVLQSSISSEGFTYKPITNNYIPPAYQDPGGQAIMAMIPQPNYDPASPGPYHGYNYVLPVAKNGNGMMFHSRVDYNLSDNTKLYVTYNYQGETTTNLAHIWWNPSFSVPIPGGFSTATKSHTLSANFLHVFSPTLTLDLTGTYSRINFPYQANSPSEWSREAFNYPYKGYFNTGSQRMIALSDGYWVPGYPQMDMPDFFGKGGTFLWQKTSPTFQGNVTKVWRTHTLKFGGYTERAYDGQGAFAYLNGQVYFEPAWPGQYTNAAHPEGLGSYNPVANILLGVPTNYNEDQTNQVTNMSYRTIAGYAMDSWKVTKRLSVDVGVRLDHIGPWHDNDNTSGFAVWTPTFYQSDITAGLTSPGFRWKSRDPGVPNSGNPSRFAYVSPRMGMALDLFGTGNTVLRGGWGRYRWAEQFNDSQTALQLGHGAKNFTFAYNWDCIRYLWEVDTLASRGATGCTSAGNVTGLDPLNDERSLTTSYNLTISQKTPWKSLLEVAYVGNTTDNMHTVWYSGHGGLTDINLIPMGYTFTGDAARGLGPICSPLPSCAYDASGRDNYRPYPYYAALNVVKSAAYANYNALQVSWQRQTGRAAYNLNYSFSKAMGVRITHQFGGPVGDPTNMRNNYGVLNSDRTHVFNASYTFDLGSLYKGGQKLLGGAANGWTIAGITTVQSGPNLQASPDDGDANFRKMAVTPNGLSYTDDGSKEGMLWFGTPDIKVMPMLTCNPTKGLQKNQYINGNCFTLPPLPTQNADGSWNFSNGPFIMPYIRGPMYFNSDLSVYKTFKITERHNLQFRFSAFNWLNHPLTAWNYYGDALQLRFAQDASGQWTQTNSKFGYADMKSGRRVVEFALKYSF